MLRRWGVVATALASCLQLLGCGGSQSTEALATWDTSHITAADSHSALPRDWHEGVFMQIFVRGYQDSNGDGIGDLRGLTQRLDYLKSLGVSGLWLMPIHPSQDRDHGYAVTDYRAVAPEYGTLADLDELLSQAHARGIGVVLDYVMNHSAAQHPAFLNARSDRSNPFRDWYVWQDGAPVGWSIYGSNPWHRNGTSSYFAGFWDQMPDFNLKSARVVDWHHDNLRFWLNRDVDGFRFDAVANLVENGPQAWENQDQNHALMANVQALVAGFDNRFLVCEAPSAPRAYARGESCGHAFAFGYQNALIAAVRGQPESVAAVARYFNGAPDGLVGFASNHDAFAGQRLADQLGASPQALRLAAATYLLQTHSPFIYYGEEVGMAGAATLSGDASLRTPMSWSADTQRAGFTTGQPFRTLSSNVAQANVADQEHDPHSLLAFYRDVIALRQSLEPLRRGAYQGAQTSGATMVFRRSYREQTSLVAINFSNDPQSVSLTVQAPLANLKRRWPVGASDLQVDASGNATASLPAQSFAVFSVER